VKIKFIVLFSAVITTMISCNRLEKKEFVINPAWHKLSLPNGWIVYAPSNFTTIAEHGVDSEPGLISSKKDSIFLQYDSGPYESNNKDCDLKRHFQEAKSNIDTGFYKSFYKVPLVHQARIDTIDSKIAVIVTPTKIGEGTVEIEIPGCKDQAWLGITGRNLTAQGEKLVLEIFKTIRLNKKNDSKQH
jgi:hypothetical protein